MLKNLREGIPSLFRKLNLTFAKHDSRKLDEYLERKERFFIAIIKTKGKKKLLLKVRLQKNKKVIKDFKGEIGLYQAFKKTFKDEKTGILFPEIISFGKYKNIQWYLKKYQEGELAGYADKDFGLKKEFLKNTSSEDLAEGINNYQKHFSKEAGKLNLYCQGSWWYWQDFNFYQKTFLKNFLRSNLNQKLLCENDLEIIKKIIKKNKKLLDEEAKYLCHGDLYPNNILITPSKKISILDWGKSNLNNRSFDPAFIYLTAWRNKTWQKEFLDIYLKNRKNKEKFKKLFQVSLISLSVRLSGHCLCCLKNKTVKRKNKKRVLPFLEIYIKNLKTAIYNLDSIL